MRSFSRPSPRRRTSRSSPSSLWAYRGSFQASARIRADIQGETGLRIKEARTKRMTTAKELEELGLVAPKEQFTQLLPVRVEGDHLRQRLIPGSDVSLCPLNGNNGVDEPSFTWPGVQRGMRLES